MWRVLLSRNGACLWAGRAGVFLGDQLHELILAWLVWDITKSSTATGLVLFASHLPYWVLGWIAGVAADRWPAGLVVLYANAIRAIVAVAILVLWSADLLSIVLLAALSFTINACATIDAPAFHAQIPQLVALRDIQSTNALADNTKRVGRMVAPMLLAGIGRYWAAPAGYLLVAISFGVMSVCQLLFKPLTSPRQSTSGSLVTQLKDGWMAARQSQPLFRLILCFALYNPAYGACFYVILPRLMGSDLGGGLDGFSLAVGAFGAGGLIGSLVFGAINLKDRVACTYGAFVILATGFLLLAFSPTVAVAVLICGVSALGLPMMDICMASLIHEGVDPGHYGKVYSFWRYLAEMGLAVGVLLGGPIADTLGTSMALVIFAVSVFVVVLLFALGPHVVSNRQ